MRAGATIETVGAGTINLRERAGGKRAYLRAAQAQTTDTGTIVTYRNTGTADSVGPFVREYGKFWEDET